MLTFLRPSGGGKREKKKKGRRAIRHARHAAPARTRAAYPAGGKEREKSEGLTVSDSERSAAVVLLLCSYYYQSTSTYTLVHA